jgi:hypothetical protein
MIFIIHPPFNEELLLLGYKFSSADMIEKAPRGFRFSLGAFICDYSGKSVS